MANRQQKDLIDQINATAKRLNIDPPPKTDGLGEQQLQEMLDSMKQQESARAAGGGGAGTGGGGGGGSAGMTAGATRATTTDASQPSGAAAPRVGDATTTATPPPGGRTGTSADGSTTTKEDTTQLLPPGGESSSSSSGKYRVASGRSISGTNRGHLDAGAEVTAADFAGGDQRLQELVKAGIVEQGDPQPQQSGQPGPGGDPVMPAGGQTTDPNVQQTNQPGLEPKS